MPSVPALAAPHAGERAAGWRWCAAVCKTERARAWMPDDGAVTFHALEPLQKHRRDKPKGTGHDISRPAGSLARLPAAVGGGVS